MSDSFDVGCTKLCKLPCFVERQLSFHRFCDGFLHFGHVTECRGMSHLLCSHFYVGYDLYE